MIEMPNSPMNPIAAEMESGVRVMASVKIPPTIAIGRTLNARAVSPSEEKFRNSSNAIRARETGTTTSSLAIAFLYSSSSPTHSRW